MAIAWFAVLKPDMVLWHLEHTSRSGGASLTGSEQIVASSAGRWRARVGLTTSRSSPTTREDAILALRTLLAELEGRTGEVLLPTFDGYVPRDDNGRRLGTCDAAPMSGGIHFFEHWGFAQSEDTHATVSGATAQNATSVVMDVDVGQGLRPGMYFGIGERMYRAKSVTPTTGSLVSVRFGPPLREPAPNGTRVIFDRPVCTMRLDSDDSGQLELAMRRFGYCTLEFVEAI